MDGDIAPLRGTARAGASGTTPGSSSTTRTASACWRARRAAASRTAGLASDAHRLMGTLGKAAGVAGAFVAAHPAVVETLVQTARPYVYTTAAPPALAHALRDERRADPRRHRAARRGCRATSRAFAPGCAALPWRLVASATAIQPLMVGANEAALALADGLWRRGFCVPAIRPPTVPSGRRGCASRCRPRTPRRTSTPARGVAALAPRAPGANSDDPAAGRDVADRGPGARGGLYVESTGSGPPLVLLHGWAMHGGLFAPVVARLSRAVPRPCRRPAGARAQPGAGGDSVAASSRPSATRSIAADAPGGGGVRAPVTLIGWSLGGAVALAFAHARPERVARLVLVGATPRFVAADDWPHAMTRGDAGALRRRARRLLEAHAAAVPRAAGPRQRPRPRGAARAAPRAVRARRAGAGGAARRARAAGGRSTCARRCRRSPRRRWSSAAAAMR